ncbi:NAD-dependent epimerase/dehydratase family protein [Paenibacillus thiaminolyticus]|uniref:NAD-dependent epimerase/dehydratase family protein n=1 Tax=Paenibacillus thiaminolyticus TaxID=49283 RepID=UPI003D2C46FE
MNNALIGYTGFVGSNLKKQMGFTDYYNSQNIKDIENKSYDIIVCAGVKAEKWFATKYPEKDMESINILLNHLQKVKARKFILISTIDVYDKPVDVDENTIINVQGLQPYGLHRYYVENWVKSNFDDYLILRLPALFGKGLKKNFIFDLLTINPSVIMEEKMKELQNLLKDTDYKFIESSYNNNNNGTYSINNDLKKDHKMKLKEIFFSVNFTSLTFTDERSKFSFYDLMNLGRHIEFSLKNNLSIVNLAVEPISAKELAKEVFNYDFDNIIDSQNPAEYDFRTIHTRVFKGEDGYIYKKNQVINQIKRFVREDFRG